jgi:ribosomal protein L11 methyltransferase
LSARPETPAAADDGARWQIEFEARHGRLGALEAALEPWSEALSTEAIEEAEPLASRPEDRWRLRAIAVGRAAAERIAAAARTLLEPGAEIAVATLPARDWVAEVERGAPPIRCGRFLIHGSHQRMGPCGRLSLVIDAGLAFGSGHHATTRGCLVLIERLARRRRRLTRALDLGAGSGVLAVAIARLWHCPVLAADLDPEAVRASRRAACANAVAPSLRAVRSRGLAAPAVRQGAPYDLIVANILAGPLIGLAPSLARALAPAGRMVLSGLLREQEGAVIAACRARRLVAVDRLREGAWSTLAFAHAARAG